ncbi:MAG: hypothetical protein ACE5JQ_00740 [Candidatus Methylomirabilales bacterium]
MIRNFVGSTVLAASLVVPGIGTAHNGPGIPPEGKLVRLAAHGYSYPVAAYHPMRNGRSYPVQSGYRSQRIVITPLASEAVTNVPGREAELGRYAYPRRSPAPVNDPTLVRIVNASRYRLKILVDGEELLEVATGYRTPDLHFDVGQHTLEITAEVITHFGPRKVSTFTQHLTIDPKGTPLLLTIRDSAFRDP